MESNNKQVGGEHYTNMGYQHWDYVLLNGIPYLEAQATRYLSRWKLKNGLEDLQKAQHYLEKLVEWEKLRPWYSRLWQKIIVLGKAYVVKAEEYCWINNMTPNETVVHIYLEHWHLTREAHFIDRALAGVKDLINEALRKAGK